MEMVELIGVLDWIDGLEWDPHVRGFLAVFAGFCVSVSYTHPPSPRDS